MRVALLTICLFAPSLCPAGPYDERPEIEPPYYRIRYEASTEPASLQMPVQYALWIPPGVETLRGIVVHQHGCGTGSSLSGLTGAFDLHWQALAKAHDMALLSPSYEQPENMACAMWCDPRNGSDAAFQRALTDLGEQTSHPELSTVPWALWGHSGGATWVSSMTLLHPERVAAVWMRSGSALLERWAERPEMEPLPLTDAALEVPMMINLGTKEGFSDKKSRFKQVWPRTIAFTTLARERGAKLAVSIDPLTSHECGNQRYLAMPWFDRCLELRMPETVDEPLRVIEPGSAWLAPIVGGELIAENDFEGEPTEYGWLPDHQTAMRWSAYMEDSEVPDTSPPPAPTDVAVEGHRITWEAEADLESGIEKFLIEREGIVIGEVTGPKHSFGRPRFQGLQYSDTPKFPLAEMQFVDPSPPSNPATYRVISVNTAGLQSE